MFRTHFTGLAAAMITAAFVTTAQAQTAPPTVAAMPSTMSLVAAFFLTGAAPMERRMPERVALMASAPIGLGTLAILCM